MKLVNTSQQRLDLIKNRNSVIKSDQKDIHGNSSNSINPGIKFINTEQDEIVIPTNMTEKTETTETNSKENIVSESRIVAEEKKEMLIGHMLTIITEQQKANEKWLGICQSKNETILSLKTKLKELIDSSRSMILSQ